MCNLPDNPHIPGHCPTRLKDIGVDLVVEELKAKMRGNIAVVGCGHVGLPLLGFLVSKNVRAFGIDIVPPKNNDFGRVLNLPFKEDGLEDLLKKYVVEVVDYQSANELDIAIITVGTPIDKNHNPDTSQIRAALKSLVNHNLINDKTLIIMRSTLFPGACEWIQNILKTEHNIHPDIAFAPERIAEGYALKEIYEIPQPIGGLDKRSLKRATEFFTPLVKEIIPMSSTRATEFVKLFSNGFRYVNFALANEFAMKADEMDVNYEEIRNAVNHNYSRGGLAKAALNVGGYCLAKDWCLLDHKSTVPSIVKKAYEVAEKTPVYYANKFKDEITSRNVGILGLAFKPGSDNSTDSLSHKMIKMCEQYNAEKIFVHDPHIKHDKYNTSLDVLMNNADIVFVMTEHPEFSNIAPINKFQIMVRL